MIVVADALAKVSSRRVTSARCHHRRGRRTACPRARERRQHPGGRRAIFKHIGRRPIQHRSPDALIAKPDAVWDRADLEQLYARPRTNMNLRNAEALGAN
jgi:hypothetical protein